MRVLVVGAKGQLGWELLRTAPDHHEAIGADVEEVDIRSRSEVASFLRSTRPGAVINAAAYTAVDRAETEAEAAFQVNADGAGNLALAARDLAARLVHVSTDFVFDGAAARPYRPSDNPRPLGVYGASKLEGERRVMGALGDGERLIIRTAWLYSSNGANFVKTMLGLMGDRDEIGVVADQIGSPTWARGLAEAVWKLLEMPSVGGFLHWTDEGVASWYDFAVAIYEEASTLGLLERPVRIRPIGTDEYPTPARRPAFSVLDLSRPRDLFGKPGLHWRVALRRMLRELAERSPAE